MKKLSKFLILSCVLIFLIMSLPELFHRNKHYSKSTGTVSNGQIENAFLIPYFGKNFQYFSPISYFIMNNGYVHSKVHKSVTDSYKSLEIIEPERKFYIMECSDKHGGKLHLHKTHQNGLSIDFMTPLKTKSFHPKWNYLGLFHYLLEFDQDGKLSFDKHVEIDFELMAKHILELDKSCRKNGLRIRMVILKIDLKDNLFSTETGKLLKKRGIYFAQSLPKWTDKMHDDHYHIDFEMVK